MKDYIRLINNIITAIRMLVVFVEKIKDAQDERPLQTAIKEKDSEKLTSMLRDTVSQ